MTNQQTVIKFQTTIVVLAYNGCEALTRPCIESLLKYTPAGSFELVLVDNASIDETPAYFRHLASKYPFVKICLNSKNKGYAGGNNDGIRLASGRYIVLLNNDTLVSSGWLEPLLQRLEITPEIGLLGPVTNSAGNEQRVVLEKLGEQNFGDIARKYTEVQKNRWFKTDKLGFFCVAGRREVFERVGMFDESFGIGMFEDDDYCVRVLKAGYILAVVEDSFVLHKGSMSFKMMPTQEHQRLFEKNQIYFYEKNEIVWTYADIAIAIWRCIKKNIINGGVASQESTFARLQVMDDALYQLHQREQNTVVINGISAAESKLQEKQRQLMEISDWAAKLNKENMKINAELERLHSSFIFRALRRLKLVPQ